MVDSIGRATRPSRFSVKMTQDKADAAIAAAAHEARILKMSERQTLGEDLWTGTPLHPSVYIVDEIEDG